MLSTGVVGVLGDILCKLAASNKEYEIFGIAGCALCWGFTSIIWFAIFKNRTLTEMGALYGPFFAVLTSVAGVILFKDAITWKIMVAALFSACSIWLVSKK